MNEREEPNSSVNLTAEQEALRDLCEQHIQCEFATPSTESTQRHACEFTYVVLFRTQT
jgi:hypothetical protein